MAVGSNARASRLDRSPGRIYGSRVNSVPHLAGLDLATAIAMGIGLAAAVGFRVFLPMLVLGIAAYSGHLTLSSGLSWLGTPASLMMLSVAAAVEVLAYYVPGVDNALDVIATPVALISGAVVSAAVLTDLPPMVKWTTAVIAGSGAAGLTQGLTSLVRAKSTITTAGFGNPVVATGELGGALALALLALFAPLVAAALVAVCCWLTVRLLRSVLRKSRTAPNSHSPRA